jgi:hypothetical protein
MFSRKNFDEPVKVLFTGSVKACKKDFLQAVLSFK